MRFHKYLIFSLAVILSACGGGSSSEQTTNSPDASVPETNSPNISETDTTDEPSSSLPAPPQTDPITPETPPLVFTGVSFTKYGFHHERESIVSASFRLSNRKDGSAHNELLLSQMIVKENNAQIGDNDFLSLQKRNSKDIQSDLYIAIDIGSSFSPSDIESIKASVKDYVLGYIGINKNNRISIYTFDSSIKLTLPLTRDKNVIEDFMGSIYSASSGRNNSTNLYSVIEDATETMRLSFSRQFAQHDTLIFITDGIHNTDERKEADIVSLIVDSNDVKRQVIPIILKSTDAYSHYNQHRNIYSPALYNNKIEKLPDLFIQAESIIEKSHQGIYTATYITPKRSGNNSLSIDFQNNPSCLPEEILCNVSASYNFVADGYTDTSPEMEIIYNGKSVRNSIHVADESRFLISTKMNWSKDKYNFSFKIPSNYKVKLSRTSFNPTSTSYYVPKGFNRATIQITEPQTNKFRRVFIRGDIDQDGYINSNDTFPNDPTEYIDTDADGIGNNADPDDDNDLYSDDIDQWPLNPSLGIDQHITMNNLSPKAKFDRNRGITIGYDSSYRLSGLGDVNGDGFSDIAIGDPFYKFWRPNSKGYGYWRESAGKAHIIYGINTDSSHIGLSSQYTYKNSYSTPVIDNYEGYSFHGSERYKYIGHSVAGVGDMNGDGNNDIAIGTHRNSRSLDFLQHTGASFFLTQTPSPKESVLRTRQSGVAGITGAGQKVSAIGDINGDGYDDVAVQTNDSSSRLFIIFGNSSMSEWIDIKDNYNYKLKSKVIYMKDENVSLKTRIGDINGDGYDDIIVTADTDKGSNHLIYGTGGARNINLDNINEDTGFSFDNVYIRNFSHGDINDDGLNDLFLAHNGSVKIVFGQPRKLNPQSPEDLINLPGISIQGITVKEAGVIGDFDGDGYSDIALVGDYQVAIIYGKANWDDSITQSTLSNNGGIYLKIYQGKKNTLQIHRVGDFNGDGFDDIMMKASDSKIYIKYGYSRRSPDLEAISDS